MINFEDNKKKISSELSKFGYSYVKQIGKGTFAVVHLIYSEKYHQNFALKQNIKSSRFELINEFELLKKLLHPNIINLYSMIDVNSKDCIILEYCSGGTLQDFVERKGPIQPPKLYNYCHQILSAVVYLHQNKIAHRDIKPSNLLLDEYDRIKLTDFGLSQHVLSTVQIDFCGSKFFIPPEIWNHVQDYDPFSADVYSLGVLLYYISQGQLPFFSFTEEALKNLVLKGNFIMKNTDPELEELIHKIMKKDLKERPNIFQIKNESFFKRMNKSRSDSSLTGYEKITTDFINEISFN
jgi:serine/threonine protein kinase